MTDLELRLVTSLGSPGLDHHFSTSGTTVSGHEEVTYDVGYPQHPDVFAHLRARNGEKVIWRTGPEGRIHACVAPILTADREVTGVVGFAVDFGRAAEEERRRKSMESLLRHLLHAFPSPISVLDGGGRVILANSAYLHAVGKSEEEVIARREQPPILIRPATTSENTTHPPVPAKEGVKWNGSNGELFQSRITPLESVEGSDTSIHIALDVTREEAFKRDLENCSNNFDLIFSVVDRPLAILDESRRIQQANNALAGILNVPPSYLHGTSIDRWIGASSREGFGSLWRSAQAGCPSKLNGILLHGENAPGSLASISAFRVPGLGGSHLVLLVLGELREPWADVSAAPACREVSEIDARILELLATGHSNSDISQMLQLSRQGLDYRLKLLRVQLGAASRGALVARAYSLGLFCNTQWPPQCRRPKTDRPET